MVKNLAKLDSPETAAADFNGTLRTLAAVLSHLELLPKSAAPLPAAPRKPEGDKNDATSETASPNDASISDFGVVNSPVNPLTISPGARSNA